MGVTSSLLYDDQDLSHLLRLVRGDAVPEELDDQLGDSARVFAKAMRSATNGVAPVEKLATLPGGDELARLLRTRDGKPGLPSTSPT